MKLDPMELFREVINVAPMQRREKYVAYRSTFLAKNGNLKLAHCMCHAIIFLNGTSMSVQASENHYCFPKNNEGPYTHVEVGFLDGIDIPDSWKEYAQPRVDPRQLEENDKYVYLPWREADVFMYVPISLVEAVIRANM